MKKSRPAESGGNWMDTYGDMVTLLLCFFVMLYSMSTLNEQKWEVFVRSIYPATNAEMQEDLTVDGIVNEEEDASGGTPDIPETEVEIDMNTLYLTLAQMMNEKGVDGVTISRGEDYTFIIFQDKTFFDGDSSTMTDTGKEVLDIFCEAIAPADDQLEQVNIMAHTAQGNPDRPNNPRTDRMLSAMRAAEVCVYIQLKDVIRPEKIVDISYGQFRPVAGNDTREGRARNRRVELLMIDAGADVRSLNEYYEEYTSGINAETTIVTDGQPVSEDHGFAPIEPSEEGVLSLMPAPGAEGAGASPEPAESPETSPAGTMSE